METKINVVFYLLAIVLTLSKSDPTSCPRGQTKLGHSCYLLSTQPASWIQAMKYCTVFGGELAKIETADEFNTTKNFVQSNWNSTWNTNGIWIGGTDLLVENDWIWASGLAPIENTFWAPGRPDARALQDNCLQMTVDQGFLWDDENCGKIQSFLCEKSLDHNYLPPNLG